MNYPLRPACAAFALVACAAVFSSCGSNEFDQRCLNPAWVLRGSGAFLEEGDYKVMVGVGMAWQVKDAKFARSMADNRARAALARVFKAYSKVLMKHFTEVARESDAGQEGARRVEAAIMAFANASAGGVVVVERWVNPIDNTHNSLARLDLESLRTALAATAASDSDTRDFVMATARTAFERLKLKSEKRR